MVTVNNAEDLRKLILLPKNVIFIINGVSPDANKLRDFAVLDEGSIGDFSRIVAQTTDAKIVDAKLLDPFLRRGKLSTTSADLGSTVGKKNLVAAVVTPEDEISRGTTTLCWMEGDSQ